MNIKKYIKDAYTNAFKKGFYDCNECDGIGLVGDFKSIPCDNCKQTGIDLYKKIEDLALLIICEITEAYEAYKRKSFANIKDYESYSFVGNCSKKDFFELYIKDSFEDELADCFIMLFSIKGYLENSNSKTISYRGGHFRIMKTDEFYLTGWNKDLKVNLLTIIKNVIDFDLTLVFDLLYGLCKYMNIDIEKHIQMKMEYNSTRPRLHKE